MGAGGSAVERGSKGAFGRGVIAGWSHSSPARLLDVHQRMVPALSPERARHLARVGPRPTAAGPAPLCRRHGGELLHVGQLDPGHRSGRLGALGRGLERHAKRDAAIAWPGSPGRQETAAVRRDRPSAQRAPLRRQANCRRPVVARQCVAHLHLDEIGVGIRDGGTGTGCRAGGSRFDQGGGACKPAGLEIGDQELERWAAGTLGLNIKAEK